MDLGDKYTWCDGDWKDGHFHGTGTCTWSNGAKCNRERKHGAMNGRGTATDVEGKQYDGEYRNGRKHGKREGNPAGWQKHGKGISFFASGEKHSGHWELYRSTARCTVRCTVSNTGVGASLRSSGGKYMLPD